MNNYDEKINTRKPEGIERKRAFLIGAGIASLAAAEYLMRDGHMQGSQITIFEEGSVAGGAMDGAGNPQDGFIVRGGIRQHTSQDTQQRAAPEHLLSHRGRQVLQVQHPVHA